jgi:hypothetical protein
MIPSNTQANLLTNFESSIWLKSEKKREREETGTRRQTVSQSSQMITIHDEKFTEISQKSPDYNHVIQ